MGPLPAPPPRRSYERGTVPIDYVGWVPTTPVTSFGPLSGDLDTSVAVVGAGLAGASLALHLAERGVDTVLLEAEQPGVGASGRNAGHVQPYLATMKPTREWPDQGARLLEAVREHRDIIYDLAARHGIDCDAARTGMVEAASRRYPELERKASRWRKRGFEVDVVGPSELSTLLGTDTYPYGVHWQESGRVNPYLFNVGLAGAAADAGATVAGDTPVLDCVRSGSRWLVRTAHGEVRADRVVICTNGHAGNRFFPALARTNYPLVAFALSTKPLPAEIRAAVNPSRVALTQYPASLFPMVIDERERIITASIPRAMGAHLAKQPFAGLLRYLHRTFPVTRSADIELESYWTGMTANSSSVYHADYPKLYRVDDGVMALMNLGTWGVFLGPLLGMDLARAIAEDRPEDTIIPVEDPERVRFPGMFALKIRHAAIPAGRVVDRLDVL